MFAMLASQETAAQNAHPGRIVGHIDGISQDADHSFLLGWACQQGQSKSIAVKLFAEKAANGLSKQGPLFAETANLFSEPGVAEACRDSGGGKHRFIVVLPYGYGRESNLSIYGIRVVDGVPNDLIAGSGAKLALKPLDAPYPALPPLGGSYRSLTQHPGVFMTADELKDMALRINRPGSYSMRRFGQLAKQIARDLESRIDWDVTYAGPDAGVYEYAFSYEPQDQHDADTRAALKIPASVKAPAGAAVVASRLSLYAALLKAGASVPPGSPTADESMVLAKRILLAWADRGFRDTDGHFQALGSFTRDGHGRPTSGLGITLGRGIIDSVHAQDLLEGMGGLNSDEIRRLNAFHGAIFELIRQSENVLYAGVGFPYSDCSRYTNRMPMSACWQPRACSTTSARSGPFSLGATLQFLCLLPGRIYSTTSFTGNRMGPLPDVSATMSRTARVALPIITTTRQRTPRPAKSPTVFAMPSPDRASAIRCSPWNVCLTRRSSCALPVSIRTTIGGSIINPSKWQSSITPATPKVPLSTRRSRRRIPVLARTPRSITAGWSTASIACCSSVRKDFPGTERLQDSKRVPKRQHQPERFRPMPFSSANGEIRKSLGRS